MIIIVLSAGLVALSCQLTVFCRASTRCVAVILRFIRRTLELTLNGHPGQAQASVLFTLYSFSPFAAATRETETHPSNLDAYSGVALINMRRLTLHH